MSETLRSNRREAIIKQLKCVLGKDEVEHVIRKWMQFEREINGAPRDIEVFRKYITYQMVLAEHLFNTCSDRKSLLGMVDDDLTNLFELCFRSGFTKDYKILRIYFSFCCTREQQKQKALEVLEMLTTLYASEPGSWVCGANYYFKYLRSTEMALKLINRGMSTCKQFHMEMFDFAIKLEMDTGMADIRKSFGADKRDKKQLLCDKLLIYVERLDSYPVTTNEDAKAIIKFCIKILTEKLDEHKFLRIVHDRIVKMLTEKYNNYSEMWEMLATRDFNSSAVASLKVKRCSERYKEGINHLKGQSGCRTLWTAYLNFIKDNADVVDNDTMTSAYQNAAKQNILLESDYINWFDLSMKKKVSCSGILEEGIEKLKDSKPALLCKKYMQCHMEREKMDFDELVVKFQDGCAILDSKALPLWQLMIHCYLSTNNSSMLKELFKSGMKCPVVEVQQYMKLRYIMWISKTKNFTDVRREYDSIAKEEPYCKELHVAMIRVYEVQIFTPALIENWRAIYRTMYEQFPNDPDVYKEWGNFYMNDSLEIPENDRNTGILEVYEEAKKNLLVSLFDTLIADLPLPFRAKVEPRSS